MGRIRDISRRLDSFDIMKELDTILLGLTDVITGMNKEQLSIGENAQGDSLQDYASEGYAVFKVDIVGSEAPLGTPDLKLSGDFYNGFTIILDDYKLEITSTDIKTLDLEGKYGDIFGLQPDKLTELAFSYVLPRLAQRFKQIIGI